MQSCINQYFHIMEELDFYVRCERYLMQWENSQSIFIQFSATDLSL